MMELIDCHSHSSLSGHGEGTIADAVARANELGLTTYAQTEHLVLPRHLDFHYNVSMAPHVMKDYVEELKKQRELLHESGSKMQLIIGIEADWLNNREEELIDLCQDFEYVIGSVHMIDEWAFDSKYNRDRFHELGADYVWKRYFEVWLDMARSNAPITTFGHPDLPKKFGDFPSFDPRDYYAEMAHMAAKKGRMIEVNTSGLRFPVHELYPSVDMLKAFCAAGVDCTVGCDAHRPDDIGKNIVQAYQAMYAAGYRFVASPTPDGDRRMIPLEI